MQKLPDFSKFKAMVVGDLMLDCFWQGSTTRISPEAPVPIVHVSETEDRPGGAGNVALNLAALGYTVYLDGLLGNDSAAINLRSSLENANIHCLFENNPTLSTIRKFRVLSQHQQLIRLDFEDRFPYQNKDSILQRFIKNIAGMNVVILSDYGKGTLSSITHLIAAAQKANTPILIDPKGTDFDIYKGATLLTPNYNEFATIVGSCTNQAEISTKGNILLDKLQLTALLITQGEQGMTLIQRNKPSSHFPAKSREVYDVTGAGDTVIAVLAAVFGAGMDLHQATVSANLAAGLVVAKLGTATVNANELQDALDEDMPHSDPLTTGVVDKKQLQKLVHDAKIAGKKVVFTNGCFDILHSGHIHYLQQAKELGDYLVVAVNDDQSVSSLKGASRPIVPVQERMQILSALQAVDWVISFSENTPEQLICELLPDTLVKGGDYTTDQIAGNECVTAQGGNVEIIAYKEGYSTSDIIATIKKKN